MIAVRDFQEAGQFGEDPNVMPAQLLDVVTAWDLRTVAQEVARDIVAMVDETPPSEEAVGLHPMAPAR